MEEQFQPALLKFRTYIPPEAFELMNKKGTVIAIQTSNIRKQIVRDPEQQERFSIFNDQNMELERQKADPEYVKKKGNLFETNGAKWYRFRGTIPTKYLYPDKAVDVTKDLNAVVYKALLAGVIGEIANPEMPVLEAERMLIEDGIPADMVKELTDPSKQAEPLTPEMIKRLKQVLATKRKPE